MKRELIQYGMMVLALGCATLQHVQAQELQQRGKTIAVRCEKASLVRNGEKITAGLDIDLSDLSVKSNQVAVFVPMIVKGADTLKLHGVGVYGRTRWYQLERYGMRPVSGKEEQAMRYNDRLGTVTYTETADYSTWMNGSELILMRTDYGCCGALTDAVAETGLAGYKVMMYEPAFRFQAAVAEERKTRELSGRAYIDFPVNLTTIYPEYRRNQVELAKIIATIDSVRNDKDITVESLSIKGYASPEGPYSNNIRLAQGRTEALKQYVQQLYRFDYGFIKTDYEPEDWEGLREYVINSYIMNREGILAIIDSNMEPDAKNTKIQKTYPEQYSFLLATVYPALRHSDYQIEYTIKGFTDLAEIAELMWTQPAKLSLNEMYLYAATLEPGSDRYNEVMETAVRMYPSDETAILNAAYAAMQREDLIAAERYLSKAGTSAEALYAKGVLAGMQRDYGNAIWLMEQAALKGNDGARSEIEKLVEAQQYAR